MVGFMGSISMKLGFHCLKCNQLRLFMNSLCKNLLYFGVSSSLFTGSAYCYVYYLTQHNKKDYEDSITADTLRDASRLTNQSFGISWGFQADDLILGRIDSGDLLFMRFNCSECLSVNDYISCHKKTMFSIDEENHMVGFTYRDSEGVYVLFNQFGVTRVMNYTDFMSLPFLHELKLQKAGPGTDIHQQLKQVIQKQQNASTRESQISFVNRILNKLKQQQVYSLDQLKTTSQQIVIRTETSRSLRSL